MKELQNINLITLSIVIFILICVEAIIYYINNISPKIILIKDDIETIENDKTFEIESIEKGKIFSKITIKKKMKDSELKKYNNYTLGPGENYYFNYTIVLNNNKKMYKIKTIIEDKNSYIKYDKKDDEGCLYIKGIFLNKNFFKEKYNIGIIQKDYTENYKNKSETYYKNLRILGENNE